MLYFLNDILRTVHKDSMVQIDVKITFQNSMKSDDLIKHKELFEKSTVHSLIFVCFSCFFVDGLAEVMFLTLILFHLIYTGFLFQILQP